MKFIELTQNDFVNVEIIDSQHKNFVKILEELYALLGQNKPQTIKYLLTLLVSELKIHFDTEQDLMKDHRYINYYSHKMEHNRFLAKCSDYKDKVLNGNEKLNLEMLKSFKNWFYNHIELNDKKLGDFLCSINKK